MEQSNIEEKADMLDRIMIEWFLHADEDRDWTYLYDLFEESTDKFYSPIGVIDDPCYDSLAETKTDNVKSSQIGIDIQDG